MLPKRCTGKDVTDYEVLWEEPHLASSDPDRTLYDRGNQSKKTREEVSMIQKFKLKEIVFIAIFSAALLLVSALIMPLVMFTNMFALRQVLAAPVFGLFCTIALMKVPKIGTLTLIGIFSGVVLLFMSPIMFYNNLLGALIVELLVIVFFRGYTTQKKIVIASALYMPITIPITLPMTSWLKGVSIADQLQNQNYVLLLVVGSVVLGFMGAILGSKIGKELQRIGKL